MHIIDAQGRACPEPVLLTKKALKDHPEGLDIQVDNIVAAENITRFGQNLGYQVNRQEQDGVYTLSLRK